jgi:hypothetical protein
MTRVRQQTWKTVAAVAVILLVLALIFTGNAFVGVALLVVFLAMAGGALMYRKLGPPER